MQLSEDPLANRHEGKHRALAQEWDDINSLLEGDAAVAGSAATVQVRELIIASSVGPPVN